MTLPSQDYLQSRIDYNPQTGEARWKPVDSSYGRTWRHFNATSANSPLPRRACLQGVYYTTSHLVYKLHFNIEVARLSYANNNAYDLRIDNLLTSSNIDDKVSKLVTYSDSKKVCCKPIDTCVFDYLRYDHRSGDLVWKYRNDNTSWSSRWAGKIAGNINKNGYCSIKINYNMYLAHRVAWYLYYGVDPTEYQIDHIDTNRSNNSIQNLRLANRSYNVQHSHSDAAGYLYSNNAFRPKITINNNKISLGTYNTEAEARQAYEAALQKYKPIYQFTPEEQNLLDQLYNTYPNCSSDLQHACHELQVKALNYYVDAAIVQTPKN